MKNKQETLKEEEYAWKTGKRLSGEAAGARRGT
jgi:hypothetical protein